METQQTIFKEYKYTKNNKEIIIKRKYVNNGKRELKQNELNEYFRNNSERIKSERKLQNILNDYNDNHENKISYSMFYSKYKNIFGFRKNRRNNNSDDSEN